MNIIIPQDKYLLNYVNIIPNNSLINSCTIISDKNYHIKINYDKNDPWESAINDEKFYINNKIARIFPLMKNFNDFGKIKIDDESFTFITIREIADLISKIISNHLIEYNLNPQKVIIVDYTAGVGGNVLSFSKFFYHTYAIELCNKRAEYLKNNVDVYGYKNITIFNQSAITFNNEQLLLVDPNVIFIDPPWGGYSYKESSDLRLRLGDLTIEELLIDIINKFSNHYLIPNVENKCSNYKNKIIVLKLPKNYDVEYLYLCIKSHNNLPNYVIKTYLHILNKMLIIVCELSYISY